MSTDTTTLRISGAADVLAAVAMQMGFHPKNSLVLISLRGERHRVGLIARIDLADGAAAAPTMVEHLLKDGASSALIVFYSDQPKPRADLYLIRTYLAYLNLLGAVGINVRDALHVGPERFISLTCDEPCCPREGWPVDALKDTVIAAEFVSRGRVARDSRDDLISEMMGDLTPADDATRAAVERRASGVVATPAQTLARWRRSVGKAKLPTTSTGQLLGGLGDPKARDAVMMALLPGTDAAERYVKGDDVAGGAMSRIFEPVNPVRPDEDTMKAARTTLLHLARCATGARAAVPLTLLGFLAWWSGDGVPARDYIDLAVKADPQYYLARLLAQTIDAGMPPGWAQADRLADDAGQDRNRD